MTSSAFRVRAVALGGTLAMSLFGCFRGPDIANVKCVDDGTCPRDYYCAVPGQPGGCHKRGGDGSVGDVPLGPVDLGPRSEAPQAFDGNAGDGTSERATVDQSLQQDGRVHASEAGLEPDLPLAGVEVGTGGTAGQGAGGTGGAAGATGRLDAATSWAGGGGGGGTSAVGGGSGGTNPGGGGSATGGAVGQDAGPTATGGAIPTGGTTPATGGAGGTTVGTGGVAATGGTTVSTGGAGTGGVTGTGGAGTGGSMGTGGAGTGGSTGSGGSGMSAGCGRAPTIPSDQYNNGTPISITVGTDQRRYVLDVPASYDNTKPYKLVLALHQLDGNDKQMRSWQYYGLLPLANDTTIFVAPNGQKSGVPCSGTGVGEAGCGWPNTGSRDLALMDAVVAQVAGSFCVDTNRIFATGWSYGASMAYELGCQRPLSGVGTGGSTATWGLRGIAVYSGAQMSGSCQPTMPIGFYGSHGTRDSVISYTSMGLPLAQKMAAANGCTWATPQQATGSHICTDLAGCKPGYAVEFCSFVGDHTPWPDNGQSAGSWGPPQAWSFLDQL